MFNLRNPIYFRTMVEMPICEEKPEFNMQKYPFNYSRRSDFVDELLRMKSSAQQRWFDERKASWRSDLNPNFLESLTTNGIGFTFNTFGAAELLNVDA